MSHILVSGLVNLETSVRVEGFPLNYTPQLISNYGISSGPAGIGYNLAKALTTLGDTVHLVSMVGSDLLGKMLRQVLTADGISDEFVTGQLAVTNQSVVLFEPGRRRILLADPKDIPEQRYPEDLFTRAIPGCSLATVGLVTFAQPLVEIARRAEVPLACDLHTATRLDVPYLRNLLGAASILFVSGEGLEMMPEDWANRVMAEFGPQVIVIGLGAEGALLSVKETGLLQRFPAVYTRPVDNTLGAGDALFSAFVHFHAAEYGPAEALSRAMVFASYKIGESGASRGFLSEDEVNRIYAGISPGLHSAKTSG
jgi:sugar/nucleoside kinase (ribokinase family)